MKNQVRQRQGCYIISTISECSGRGGHVRTPPTCLLRPTRASTPIWITSIPPIFSRCPPGDDRLSPSPYHARVFRVMNWGAIVLLIGHENKADRQVRLDYWTERFNTKIPRFEITWGCRNRMKAVHEHTHHSCYSVACSSSRAPIDFTLDTRRCNQARKHVSRIIETAR